MTLEKTIWWFNPEANRENNTNTEDLALFVVDQQNALRATTTLSSIEILVRSRYHDMKTEDPFTYVCHCLAIITLCPISKRETRSFPKSNLNVPFGAKAMRYSSRASVDICRRLRSANCIGFANSATNWNAIRVIGTAIVVAASLV
jgi:hypothetical protein